MNNAITLNRATISVYRAQRVIEGKSYLEAAQNFLHENCDNWTDAAEEEYQTLLKKAEHKLIEVKIYDEILEGVYS